MVAPPEDRRRGVWRLARRWRSRRDLILTTQGSTVSSLKFSAYRLYRHLTRRKAAWGWALALFGVLTFALYPEDWWGSDAITEASLIIASVSFSAVFLPELSSDLWTISAQDVKQLIPEERASHLLKQLVKARIPEEEWANRVLDCAVEPLLKAAMEPHLIVGDLVYTASIHLDEEITVGDKTLSMHRVETSLRGRRVLPPASKHEVYWVSIARSALQLEREFNESSCLFREVVDFDDSLSDEQWRESVEKYSRARIVLDGTTIEATTTAPPGDAYSPLETQGLLRWYFDSSAIKEAADQGRRTITLSLDYPLHANRLVVFLGAYYTMGSAQLTVRVYSGNHPVTINYDAFIARALGVSSVDVKELTKPKLCTELSVITSDDTLLWPSTGLSVWWAPAGSDRDVLQQLPEMTATAMDRRPSAP